MHIKKHQANLVLCILFLRDPEGIRTPNQRSRNPLFYPVELRSQYKLKV